MELTSLPPHISPPSTPPQSSSSPTTLTTASTPTPLAAFDAGGNTTSTTRTTRKLPTKLEYLSLLRQAEAASSYSAASASLASIASLVVFGTPEAVLPLPSLTGTTTLPTDIAAMNTGAANAGTPISGPSPLDGTEEGGAGGEPSQIGGIVGGSVGGAVVLLLALAGILVPILRRRAAAAAGGAVVEGTSGGGGFLGGLKKLLGLGPKFSAAGAGKGKDRERVNLDDPEDGRMRESLISGVGRIPYPTRNTEYSRHGTQRSLASGTGEGMMEVPLLGEGGSRVDRPSSVVYPSVSSTHMYEPGTPRSATGKSTRTLEPIQTRPGDDQRLDGSTGVPNDDGRGNASSATGKHDNLYFYYRTTSTAQGAPPSTRRGETEFDPYMGYEGTPSPLDGSFGLDQIQYPERAATPSSPKKATRDAALDVAPPSLPAVRNDVFFDSGSMKTVTTNPFDTTKTTKTSGTTGTAQTGATAKTGASSLDIYQCIENPFMAGFERSSPPQASTSLFSDAYEKPVPTQSSPSRDVPQVDAGVEAGFGERGEGLGRVSPESDGGDTASMYSQMSAALPRANSRAGTGFGSYGRGDSLRRKATLAAVASGARGAMGVVEEVAEGSPVKVGGAVLERMDTVAIGNLIKKRAAMLTVEAETRRAGSAFSMASTSSSNAGAGTVIIRSLATMDQADETESGVVRGRGVAKGEGEEDDKAGYGRIERLPVKRTGSGSSSPEKDPRMVFPTTPVTASPTAMSPSSPIGAAAASGSVEDLSLLKRARTRSAGGRGRLVPTAGAVKRARSLSRDASTSPRDTGLQTPEGTPEGKKDGVKGWLLGRSPSKGRVVPKGQHKKGKGSLQERLVEKGLLVVGASPSTTKGSDGVRKEGEEGDDDVTPKATPVKKKVERKKPKQMELDIEPPSPASAAEPSPAADRPAGSDVGLAPPVNPLTGAFGLGKPPAARSPATPTFQYAFADLEKAKGFLHGNADLRLLTEGRSGRR